MSESVEVNVTYTSEEYARSLQYIVNRQLLMKLTFLWPAAFMILTLAALFLLDKQTFVYLLFASQFSLAIIIGLALTVIISTVSIVYRKDSPNFFLRRNVKTQFESSPAMRDPKSIIFNDEGLSGSSDLGEGSTKWEAFIEAAETKEFIFLFTSNKSAQFVPKRAFTGEQLVQVRNLIKTHMGDKPKTLL